MISKPFTKALHLFFVAALLVVALGITPAKAVSVGGWQALPGGGLWNMYHSWVHSLAVSGSDVYAGGYFTEFRALAPGGGYTALGNIARYDTTTDTWHTLPGNLRMWPNDGVHALAVSGDDLYVGGGYNASPTGPWSIERYDTTAGTWHMLSNKGLWGGVQALAMSGNDLYVGGSFSKTGDGSVTDLNSIARYDTVAGTWHALSNKGLNDPAVYDSVYAIAVSGDNLYVAGKFDQTGDGSLTDLGNVARYNINTETWYALPNKGLNDRVWALAASGDDMYAGGKFSQTGDGALTNLGYIAHYDATVDTWNALPNQGLNDPKDQSVSGVHALAVSNGDLYVGGRFAQTGDGSLMDLGHIALYNTIAGVWYALPNKGLNYPVYAFAASGDSMYVGGGFCGTGDGLPLSCHIARTVPAVNAYLPIVAR